MQKKRHTKKIEIAESAQKIVKKLVKKKFNKGKIILRAGGPKSSDPIFVFNEKEGLKLEIDEPNVNIFITPTK